MSAATKLTCGVGTRPSSSNIPFKKEGDLSIILGDSATELRENQEEEQKHIEQQESTPPRFTTKIKKLFKTKLRLKACIRKSNRICSNRTCTDRLFRNIKRASLKTKTNSSINKLLNLMLSTRMS